MFKKNKIKINELEGKIKSLEALVGTLDLKLKKQSDLFSMVTNQESVVKIPYFMENEKAKLPIRKKQGDAGYDAFANEEKVVKPHTAEKISCGMGFIIPEGFAIQNVNRGGNSLGKAYGQPIWVSDAYIDPNYRGICNFLVVNLGTKPITIKEGDRVASIGLTKTYAMDFEKLEDYCKRTGKSMEEIMNTERGSSGFGASGNN